MIEAMNFEILYWHWIVFGICLVLLELLTVSFTVLWFGSAAIVVGILVAIFPSLPLSIQLILWVCLSIGCTVFWFRYVKPLSVDKTKAGLSLESIINEAGIVIKKPSQGARGIMRFSSPILGNDEWLFICEDVVDLGDRVRVVSVSGNTVVVQKCN